MPKLAFQLGDAALAFRHHRQHFSFELFRVLLVGHDAFLNTHSSGLFFCPLNRGKATYHLAIDEDTKGVYVAQEWLAWWRNREHGRPFPFLDFQRGQGSVISGEAPDVQTAAP
jgi:hypothetical protein